MARVLRCDQGDYDAVAGTCAAPYYGDAPTFLQDFTIADAEVIGAAVALLWATAYAFKVVRRMLEQS